MAANNSPTGSPNQINWGVHWFRRDLRLPNNVALHLNLKETAGRTVGLFCFDSKFLSRSDFSSRRFAFFIATLRDLRAELARFGGELLVMDCDPTAAFEKILAATAHQGLPLVTFNRDYEPFARTRDENVSESLRQRGVSVKTAADHLIVEPHEILKPDGTAYQKYSAYASAWLKRLDIEPVQSLLRQQEKSHQYYGSTASQEIFKLKWEDALGDKQNQFIDQLEHFDAENKRHFDGPLPAAGFKAAYKVAEDFKPKLPNYETDRSIPAKYGSAELSKYLKNGSLTMAQVFYQFGFHDKSNRSGPGATKFLKELIWREYYYYILAHRPDVETGAYSTKYRGQKWNNDQTEFAKWSQGKTGVPIVDAGMRELNKTGWINNRIRIIVATYLIKDLRVDWQWGERYFMNQLIDGDLAANNGNWQWVASTGAESQPYFRVMNPWRQSERFDPDGDYIKQWVPELARCPAKELHEESADRTRFGYAAPLTIHADAKKLAIAMFKEK